MNEKSLCEEGGTDIRPYVINLIVATHSSILLIILVLGTNFLLTRSSTGMIWQMIRQLQLIRFFLLFGAYLPKDIKDYISNMSLYMINFDFISLDPLPNLELPIKYSSYDKNKDELAELRINSEENVQNYFSVISIF